VEIDNEMNPGVYVNVIVVLVFRISNESLIWLWARIHHNYC
jgi:hypothetical protein